MPTALFLIILALICVPNLLPNAKALPYGISSGVPRKIGAPSRALADANGSQMWSWTPLLPPSPQAPKARTKSREFLAAHNKVRASLGHPPLVWDKTLARYARRFADTRVVDCRMLHSGGPYGENIFWASSSGWAPAEIVGVWVDENKFYNATTNSCVQRHVCGHYTQVVWRDTQKCGCARVTCNSGAGMYAICMYDPPGNYIDESPFMHYATT